LLVNLVRARIGSGAGSFPRFAKRQIVQEILDLPSFPGVLESRCDAVEFRLFHVAG
jgi:hypothetical protein